MQSRFQFTATSLFGRLGRSAVALGAFVGVCVVPVGCASTESDTSDPAVIKPVQEQKAQQVAQAGNGVSTIVDGTVLVVHLKGQPEAIGKQHGALLKNEIAAVLSGYVWPYVESRGGREMFDIAAELLETQLTEDERAEMAGIAEGSGQDIKDILLLNTFLDVASSLSGREGQAFPFTGSVMAVDSKGSRANTPMFGGTFEIAEFTGAKRPEPIVFTIHPHVGKPFTALSYPGMIGVFGGQNLDGFGFMASNVPSHLGLKPAQPFAILCRRMIHRCDNNESAVQLLLQSEFTTSHNLMLSDGNGNVWAVECAVERIAIRKNKSDAGEQSTLFCVNHFVDGTMIGQQTAPTVESAQRERLLLESAEKNGSTWSSDQVMRTLTNSSVKRNLAATVVFFPREHQLCVSVASDSDESKPFHRLTPNLTYGVLAPELIRTTTNN